jgi:hypothetical protein
MPPPKIPKNSLSLYPLRFTSHTGPQTLTPQSPNPENYTLELYTMNPKGYTLNLKT